VTFFRSSRTFGRELNEALANEMWTTTKQPLPTTLTVRAGKKKNSMLSCAPPWVYRFDHACVQVRFFEFGDDETPSKEEKAHAKEMHKMAVRLFKNILGYMGDRALQYPAMLMRELLKAGFENVEVGRRGACVAVAYSV